MSYRIISISEASKLSVRQGFLVVKQEDTHLIHLTEINTILLESQMITLTVPLLNALVAKNINVIICDNKHNPNVQCLPLKIHSRRSKRIREQMKW